MKISLFKGDRETDEPHGVLGGSIFLGMSFLLVTGLGFAYQQAAGTVETNEANQVCVDIPLEEKASVEDEVLVDSKASVDDKKVEIEKAINECRSSLDAEDVSSFAVIIEGESKKYNYDWELILAIIKTESHFDVRARSHKGARGLMQVLPSTAKWLSPRAGLKYKGRESLYDPEYNIKIGTHYLYTLHQKFGDIEKAIAAYNEGPTGLTRYLRQGKEYPPKYLAKVMGYYKELKSSSDEVTS